MRPKTLQKKKLSLSVTYAYLLMPGQDLARVALLWVGHACIKVFHHHVLLLKRQVLDKLSHIRDFDGDQDFHHCLSVPGLEWSIMHE